MCPSSITKAVNVTIKQLQRKILLNIKGLYMRKLNYPAGNATIKQQQKDIKLQYMKGSNIHLDNATIKQLQRAISLITKRQYMNDSNIPAHNATIKHHLREGFKYPCG